MRLERLQLRNFRSYDELDLDLGSLDRVAVCGPNGAGKCLPGNSRVYDADTGEAVAIESFVRDRRGRTLGLVDGEIRPVEVIAWHKLGQQPIVEVVLANGSRFRAAATHPVLTDRGIVRVGDLTPQDWMAEARTETLRRELEAKRLRPLPPYGQRRREGACSESKTADLIPPRICAATVEPSSTRSATELRTHAMGRRLYLELGGDPAIASAEVQWVRVSGIVEQGPEPCFDLTVDTSEALFLADDFVVHNSTILKAIPYAFWGEGSADEYIAQGAKEASATVEFTLEDRRLKVTRGRERGKRSWLAVEERTNGSWTPRSRHTIAQTQAYVDELLGIDAQAFEASVYSPQNQVAALIALRAGERKALLGSLLDLEHYEEWRQEAAGAARGCEGRAQGAEAQEEALKVQQDRLRPAILEDPAKDAAEAARATARLSELERALDVAIARQRTVEQVQLRTQLLARMETLREEGAAMRERNQRRKSLAKSIEANKDLPEKLEELERQERAYERAAAAAHAGFEEGKRRRQMLERGRTELQAQAVRALEQATALGKESDRLRAQAREPFESKQRCPTCQQPLDAEAHKHVCADLLRQADENERMMQGELCEVQRCHDAVERLEGELAELGPSQEPTIERPYDPQTLEELREAVRAHRDQVAELRVLGEEEDVEATKCQWEELRVRAARLPREAPEGSSPHEIRRELESTRGRLEGLRDALQKHREATARFDELALQLEEVFAARRAERERARALGILARAFSRDGIPAMILDGVVGSIEAAANRTLEELGTTLRLTLATQREKKTGGITETLDILVDDGVYERPVQTFSGGEVYRVAIALRLALAEVLSGRSLGCLLIDEVTDLDAEGVHALVEILQQLPKQVILISHAQEEIAAMPSQLLVTRDGPLAPSRVVVR